MKQVEIDMTLATHRGLCRIPTVLADKKPEDLVTKRLTAVNGDKVEITYSKMNHRADAYIVDMSNERKAVKPEDMPQVLREIHDPMVFSAFLRGVYARTRVMNNGDTRLDVIHRFSLKKQ